MLLLLLFVLRFGAELPSRLGLDCGKLSGKGGYVSRK